MIDNEKIKELAVIAQGRNPEWTVATSVSSSNGAPSGQDGQDITDVVVTLVGVELDGASEIDFKIWLRSGSVWYTMNGGTMLGVKDNWVERVLTAGFDRAYVEIVQSDGQVNIKYGPCELEV